MNTDFKQPLVIHGYLFTIFQLCIRCINWFHGNANVTENYYFNSVENKLWCDLKYEMKKCGVFATCKFTDFGGGVCSNNVILCYYAE